MPQVEQAIQEIRSGDVEQYAVVVREYQARLRAFIATYYPQREQVDEIAQRTFVWAYEHLGDYQAGTQFYAWLKAIARNMMLAELEQARREQANRKRYLEHLQIEQARAVLTAEDTSRREHAEALEECLAELPEDLHQLLQERYREGSSIRDLARLMKQTESAVKVRLFRIREMLRACVERKGVPV